MMNVITAIRRFGLDAAAVALLVVGLSGAITAAAESPPNPAARFTGAVLINGVPPPAGTTIEAKIGVTTCGVGTVFMNGSEARYKLDSPALDPGATPNCGTDGAPVTFYVNGLKADQTGSWRNYDLNQLDLTVTAAETPVASPAATPTPVAPALGNTTLDGGSSASWLAALAGLAAMAASAGVLAVLRRAR
jgi:hypothetical protein